ncbi:probable leucine-rich repeat receptor-like protein kinase At1g35710 [Lycium ferocissimum]|uniref:probable leucine-rich repeat receptor-like protein kinase At1g35710 n=1 Tax=Lycium ferocissimum TaxID=112874 RepID=UPI002815D570|nr:probable leucine-rich repeat receptor-like protein kinase At1g35710 [Lycium ferocissimum]XP_059281433.1 probable leucine-rich repeat receptor-like protein kinase At1g35710 [Lycium ferocissimum]
MASHHFIYFLVMVSLMVTNTSAHKACHPDDLKGLIDFKSCIHTDTSGRLSKWKGQDCCNWPGISCNSKTNRVVEINLPGYYLDGDDESPRSVSSTMSGTISASISLLTSLEVLDLNKLVGLTGQIPHSIGALKNLKQLTLETNQISGAIPESLCTNLTSLTILRLENNHLTGGIPESIGNLQALQKLSLSNNSLTGKIPFSITKLKSIISILLDQNQLVGEIQLPLVPGQWPSIQHLSLANNRLTGVIPNSIGYLTTLTTFSVSNNQLTGSIPSSLGNLKELQILKVNNNSLSVELSSCICGLTELSVLHISHNKIQGPLPGCVSSFKYLLEKEVDVSFKRTAVLPTGWH